VHVRRASNGSEPLDCCRRWWTTCWHRIWWA